MARNDMVPDDARPLIEAARLVATRDASTAAHLFERSLEFLGPDDERRREVILQLVPLAMWGGRPRLAERVARAEIAGAETEYSIRLRLHLAEALGLQDRWSEACAAWQELIDDPALPQGLKQRVLAGHAFALVFTRQIERARTQADDALNFDNAGDDIAHHVALETIATCLFFEGFPYEAATIATDLIATTDSSNNVELVWRNPRLLLGVALSLGGQMHEAEAVLRESGEIARRTGAMWAAPAQRCYLAGLYYRQGRWDEAAALCEEGLTLCRVHEPTWEFATLHGIYATIETRRGAFQNAERLIEAFDAIPETNHGDRAWRALAVSQIAEGRGDRSAAYAELAAVWQEADALGVELTRINVIPDLLRLAMDANDSEFGRTIESHLAMLESRDPAVLTTALSRHARGVVSHRAADLEEAIGLYGKASHLPHIALAWEELAIVWAETRHPRKAHFALKEALTKFETMGALADARRARARLRWRDVFAAPPAAESARSGKWASLTRTEKTVAELVAEGLKNQEIAARLFVSVQTVQTHLKSIFKKLGATSRSQVVREVLSNTDHFDDAFRVM